MLICDCINIKLAFLYGNSNCIGTDHIIRSSLALRGDDALSHNVRGCLEGAVGGGGNTSDVFQKLERGHDSMPFSPRSAYSAAWMMGTGTIILMENNFIIFHCLEPLLKQGVAESPEVQELIIFGGSCWSSQHVQVQDPSNIPKIVVLHPNFLGISGPGINIYGRSNINGEIPYPRRIRRIEGAYLLCILGCYSWLDNSSRSAAQENLLTMFTCRQSFSNMIH